MTKLELYTNVMNQVDTLLSNAKVTKKFEEELKNILETNLKPKSGGGSINPPKLDEDGNIVEAYCRFHQRYEPVEDMVVSKGKSKGYCKASISKWNKTQSTIKKLESSASELLQAGNFEEAQAKALEAKELKDGLNSPENYDYDEDWAQFRGETK